MTDFSDWAETVRRCIRRGSELPGAFAAVVTFFIPGRAGGTARRAVLSLVRKILMEDGRITPERLDILRRLLLEARPSSEVAAELDELEKLVPLSFEDELRILAELPASEQRNVVKFLIELAVAVGGSDESLVVPARLAEGLQFSAADFDAMRQESSRKAERRRFLRPGAGILVALIIIAVFILTATLLRSVIFGLIAAYLLLPLEKHFERRLLRRRGLGFIFMRLFDLLFAPLVKISNAVMRRTTEGTSDQAARFARRCIDQAVAQTVLVFLVVVTLIGGGLWSLTGRYMVQLKTQVSAWHQTAAGQETATPDLTAEPMVPEQSEDNSFIAEAQRFLDGIRERFANLPLVRSGLDRVEVLLHDPAAQEEFLGMVLQRSGGFFSFTANVLGTLGALAADLLLTFFFGLLFLVKLAEFCRQDESSDRKSEYLVRTVFNGNWLPGAGEATIDEANRIVSGMLSRLRVWVRGYIMLMIIDATTYTTLFYLLDVPYFPVLGLLAGCGILLPYIGPILSASITILVTLAVGGCTGAQLVGIVLCYLLYNGIIEQFILYPAVIGESLGLTTLETIVVVLLGAVLAGIPGMILALPSASILKYLVPQIYRCLGKNT